MMGTLVYHFSNLSQENLSVVVKLIVMLLFDMFTSISSISQALVCLSHKPSRVRNLCFEQSILSAIIIAAPTVLTMFSPVEWSSIA